jgi:hypothetical protein
MKILKKHSFQHICTYDGYYYKTSFPIVITYVIINHKSQGATVATKVVIDIKEAFTCDLTYVIYSRVTNQNNFKIIEDLIPNDFTCNFLED